MACNGTELNMQNRNNKGRKKGKGNGTFFITEEGIFLQDQNSAVHQNQKRVHPNFCSLKQEESIRWTFLLLCSSQNQLCLICSTVSKYALLRPNVLYYAQICSTISKYALPCPNMLYHVQICFMLYDCIAISAATRKVIKYKTNKKTRRIFYLPAHCHDVPQQGNKYLVRKTSVRSYVNTHLLP